MYLVLFLMNSVFAQAQTQGAAPKSGMTGILNMLMPFVLIIIVFYFLMIRPQQKQRKQHQEFLSNLKRGDEVITSSGIIGTIDAVSDKTVTLQIDGDVKIKILKGMVSTSTKLGIMENQK
ncbi:MAG: preprotein translocase subunit YajC [Proteobacteria bacterium]|nr:preprotein translocase subunit YajC [Pseudomonadota bacterium]